MNSLAMRELGFLNIGNLEAVSTTCGSGWVNLTGIKINNNIAIDHRPTRYRRWY